ncbi:MAG: phosphoribosylglycinamide formyltransferase [Nitrospirae bacterium]|nr:phosphoribosylglycinamide formyltransferase [Nitrospirota bacterium]MBI3351519.1 phosphoribosylglycinamide formyltransferase [Nitrospirota bacterium]
MTDALKIGVLVSGNGTNLQAIIDAIENKELNAKISVVLSNKKTAFALERARKYGLTAVYVDPAPFENRERYEQEIVRHLRDSGAQWIVLAGYMKMITSELLSAYRNHILNIHPSLLPAFTGLHAQAQALSYGVKITGCTVHLVDEGLDSGPVIVQAAVPVLESDTVDTLKSRILEKEHEIYPQALKWIAEGKLKVEGRKVRILSSRNPLISEPINPGVKK